MYVAGTSNDLQVVPSVPAIDFFHKPYDISLLLQGLFNRTILINASVLEYKSSKMNKFLIKRNFMFDVY